MSALQLPAAQESLLLGGGAPMNPTWYRAMRALFERVGGFEASSNDDLERSQFEDAGIEEVKAALYGLRDDLLKEPPATARPVEQDPHGRIEALEAQVAELRKEIDSLKQGTTA